MTHPTEDAQAAKVVLPNLVYELFDSFNLKGKSEDLMNKFGAQLDELSQGDLSKFSRADVEGLVSKIEGIKEIMRYNDRTKPIGQYQAPHPFWSKVDQLVSSLYAACRQKERPKTFYASSKQAAQPANVDFSGFVDEMLRPVAPEVNSEVLIQRLDTQVKALGQINLMSYSAKELATFIAKLSSIEGVGPFIQHDPRIGVEKPPRADSFRGRINSLIVDAVYAYVEHLKGTNGLRGLRIDRINMEQYRFDHIIRINVMGDKEKLSELRDTVRTYGDNSNRPSISMGERKGEDEATIFINGNGTQLSDLVSLLDRPAS